MSKLLNQPSQEELERLLYQNTFIHKYVKTRRRTGVAIRKQHTKKEFIIILRCSISMIDESWQLLSQKCQKVGQQTKGYFQFGGCVSHNGNYSTGIKATNRAGKSVAINRSAK